MRKTVAVALLAAMVTGCAGARPEAGEVARVPAQAAAYGPVFGGAVMARDVGEAPPPALAPAPAPPEPAPLLPPPGPPKPRSARLKSGFFNPLPGGTVVGYQADTGLDIMGVRLPVHAIAAGTLDYSEPGHTLWTGPKDTPNCVRIELDEPIPYKDVHRKDRLITHVYYAHLASLEYQQREGETPRRHVEGGELLGISGVANYSPHLHIGLLLDGDTSQAYWGTFLLADEIRRVLGGYRIGQKI